LSAAQVLDSDDLLSVLDVTVADGDFLLSVLDVTVADDDFLLSVMYHPEPLKTIPAG